MSHADAADTPAPAAGPRPRAGWWALLVVAAPLLLLWPCLFAGRTFLPYDLAQFPPASVLRTPAELQAMRAESNFDITEPPIWFVPELQRARRALLEEGALPNWHPTARTGTALLPHGHDGILNPVVWPALLAADPGTALGLVAFVNLTIAGLLMFGFLRALRLPPAIAAFGGIALALSSTLCANAHNYPRLSSLVWLPGMLWALRRAADTPAPQRWRPLTGFCACFLLTWLGGFPPYAVPASVVAVGYLGALVLAARTADRRAATTLGLQGAVALVLAAMLAAVYLLPAMSFFGASARSLTPSLRTLSQTTFDASYGLFGYLGNDLFGSPDTVQQLRYDRSPLPLLLTARRDTTGQPLPPNFNATEYAIYGGALVLWLALAGLGARGRHRWFPALALLLVLALAAFAAPLRWLFALPGIQTVPPLRFLGPGCVLLAWLAAQGLDHLTTTDRRRRTCLAAGAAVGAVLLGWWAATTFADPAVFARWGLSQRLAEQFAPLALDPSRFTAEVVEQTILRAPDGGDYAARGGTVLAAGAGRAMVWHGLAAAVLLAVAWLRGRWPRARTATILVAIAVSTVELLLAARSFDRGIRREHSDWTPVHDFLVAARATADAQGGFMIARAAPPLPDGSLPLPQQLAPGRLGPYGIRDLQVYSYFDSRSSEPLGRLFASVASAQGIDSSKGYVAVCLPDDPRVLQHPLLDLLGVRFVLAEQPLQHAGTRTGPELRGPGGEFFVYERPHPLPRAFCVERLEVLADDAAVVDRLADPDLQPRHVAYVAQTAVGPDPLPSGEPGAGARPVRFVRDHSTAIELAVGDGPAGWLLLADTWMPGWSATVDGTAVPLLRADHCLRAVYVPGGARTVTFAFAAPRQGVGFCITAAAALVLLVLWRRRRTSSPGAHDAETAA